MGRWAGRRARGSSGERSRGLTETRDEETADLIKQHAGLTAKKTWGSLSLDDQKALAELESKLSTRLTAPGETLEEREREAAMARYVDETLKAGDAR